MNRSDSNGVSVADTQRQHGFPTKALGVFAAGLQNQRLPAELEIRIGELFLDYIRVASIGERAPWSEWARKFDAGLGARGNAMVLFSKRQTNPVQAAFLNATYAGSVDSDDTHVGSMLHPGAIVFSAALAIATQTRVSGRNFLAAVAAGYETMIRIALAIQPTHFQRGFQSTATCGGFGAAAAASAILFKGRDSSRRIAETLGIVASFAGGLTQFYHSGSTVKRIHAAHATHSGVSASLLAAQGFSGPVDILEGANGFARAYADRSDFRLVEDGLGTSYRLMEVMVKMHACSARVQSAVEGILDLARQGKFVSDDVAEIHVGVPSVIVGRLTLSHPVDAQAAQMSMPFSVALALTKLPKMEHSTVLSVGDYEDGLTNRSLRKLEDRVRWNIDTDVEAGTTPESVPAKVTVRLNNGTELSTFIAAPKGSPSRPLTHQEHVERFRIEADTRFSLSASRSLVEVAETLADLDSIDSVNKLLVSAKRKSTNS
jgi:2-methylcitrate dehydratase PrpD